MGIPVLVIGESGSGKSSSIESFDAREVGIFNVAGKMLPFPKDIPRVDNATYKTIYAGLKEPKLKRYVIDDSQYLMAFDLFDRAHEVGYAKYTPAAVGFSGLIRHINRELPDDIIVYLLHHIERSEDGRIKAKTSGKMLDNQMTVEGLFSIVLYCTADDGEYKFVTQSRGTTAKSPRGMFELEIPNDLRLVDERIREYWKLDK